MQLLENKPNHNIKFMTQQLEAIPKKLCNFDKSTKYLQEEMQFMATILPKLSTNINQQQTLLYNSLDGSREYCSKKSRYPKYPTTTSRTYQEN
jgi:hypothetical protein